MNTTRSITEKALIARINRKLKPDGQILKKTRGERAILDLGYFYVIDIYQNISLWTRVDIEAFGKELGVMKDYETVE